MAKPIKAKLILRLHSLGVSNNRIAEGNHMSKHSVNEVVRIAEEQGLTYEAVGSLSEQEVYGLVYPNKSPQDAAYDIPDYMKVHEELKKVGVTKTLLYEEYCEECRRKGSIAIGKTKFFSDLARFREKNNLAAVIEHRPGDRTEVDWSGPTMSFMDKETGKRITVYLFVADLPCSRLAYVEPTLRMDEMSWLQCNIHMFEYFGGVTRLVVCDNLKTGVVSHGKGHVVELNREYEAFANHYGTAILPAAVRSPRQKNSAEGTVGDIATSIIARLRNTPFHSFEALREAVAEKLENHNGAPFQKREGSRREWFEREERSALKPLPATPYEIGQWVYGRKIQLNCHVAFEKNFYSCPSRYAQQLCDLRITPSTVSIFIGGERIKTHVRFPYEVSNKYRTDEADMPEGSQFKEWTMERLMSWASSIGPSTAIATRRIFEAKDYPEQAFNSVLSLLSLGQKHTHSRLETACEMALKKMPRPMYPQINAILASKQDVAYLEKKREAARRVEGCLRGQEYYRNLAKAREGGQDASVK